MTLHQVRCKFHPRPDRLRYWRSVFGELLGKKFWREEYVMRLKTPLTNFPKKRVQ